MCVFLPRINFKRSEHEHCFFVCPEVRLTVVAMVFIYREDTLQGPELPSSNLSLSCVQEAVYGCSEGMQLIGLDGGR